MVDVQAYSDCFGLQQRVLLTIDSYVHWIRAGARQVDPEDWPKDKEVDYVQAETSTAWVLAIQMWLAWVDALE